MNRNTAKISYQGYHEQLHATYFRNIKNSFLFNNVLCYHQQIVAAVQERTAKKLDQHLTVAAAAVAPVGKRMSVAGQQPGQKNPQSGHDEA